MAGTKSKSHLPLEDTLETGREFVRSISAPSTKWISDELNDVAKESGKTFIEQLLGLNLHSNKEPIKADQAKESKPDTGGIIEIFNLTLHRQNSNEQPAMHAEKSHSRAEAAIDYHREIVQSRERSSKSENREMMNNIEQIKIELSKLVESSQVLKLEFAEVSVEQSNTSVGEYHINFFEWMLAVIRTARQKVEDSSSWLGTVQGKGDKKGYWGMFKKHGTTFGLSGERAVATQVG
ncbi:MAG TPA: DUF5660 family protein [Candidatus Saccharimonadales bacterium]|nr:DUF5660 family protein [Candidatus Saccharimonadales bacterium]